MHFLGVNMADREVFELLDDLGCGKRSGETLLQKEEQSTEALSFITAFH